jgi:heme exporter protein C
MIYKILLTIWMALIIVASFLYTEAATGFPGETSRIIFFHVPQAWVATLSFLISMIASAVYLARRKARADYVALSAAELGFLFCVLATVTGAVSDPERRRVFAGVYSILAFVTVPFLVFVVPRITTSLHPEDTMNPANPGMDAKTLKVFLGSLLAYTALYVWMLRLRVRILRLEGSRVRDLFREPDDRQ